MASPASRLIDPDEYLAMERAAEFRSEYWHGTVVAMSGATRKHRVVTTNLYRSLDDRVGERCWVAVVDMKVGTNKRRGFAYPDVVVTCGEPRFLDEVEDIVTNPAAIFEVLSDSTRAFDLGLKFIEYQKLASLRHYVAVEQKYRMVVHWARTSVDAPWSYVRLTKPDDVLHLTALGVDLPLSEVYARLDIPAEED